MTDHNPQLADSVDDAAASNVPYESVPELAANETFIDLMNEARALKARHEQDDARLDEIRIEAGALVMVAGQKSVAFQDIRVVNVDGGFTKGKITGKGLLESIELMPSLGMELTPEREHQLLLAICAAAVDVNPAILVDLGFPATLIEGARGAGSPRKASTKLEWVGGKGKGGKKRAAGSGGAIQ
jgi:hypothetical protein